MLKASSLLRVGKAHVLRMRYVQMTHTLCILQCHCTRGRIVSAMSEILEGWADAQGGASRLPRVPPARLHTKKLLLPIYFLICSLSRVSAATGNDWGPGRSLVEAIGIHSSPHSI
jgi:hypothetical protein